MDYLPSPLDIPPVDRPRPAQGRRDAGRAPGVRRGAVLRPGVQDHDRPVRRPARVHPRLLGRDGVGLDRSTTRPRARPSASAVSSRCTRTSARRSRRSTPATSPPPSASGASRRATRSATRRSRSCSSRWTSPSRSSRWPSSRRPRPTRRSSGQGLGKLQAEDPTFRVQTDAETGQVVIRGMGELHLEIIVDRLKREFSVEASVGRPQVAYKETLTQPGARARAATCGRPAAAASTATSKIRLVPAQARRGLRVRERDRRRRDPARVHQADRGGHPRGAVRAACWPATRSTTSASSSTTGRSTRWTRRRWRSRSPARWRSRTPPGRPSPVLLEPVMRVEVVVPEEYMGDIMGDLSEPARPHRSRWRRAAARRS